MEGYNRIMIFANHTSNWIGAKRNQACNGDLSHNYVDTLVIFNKLYWHKLSNTQLTDIDDETILKFYNWINTHDLSKGYKGLIMTCLKNCIEDACRALHIPAPSFPNMKGLWRSRKVPTVLTEEQQDEVLRAIPDTHKPIVTLLFYHGLRVSEACNLRWFNYSWGNRTLTVNTIKDGPERVILLEPVIVDMMRDMPNYNRSREEHIFLTDWPGNSPYTRSILYKIIKRALRDAGFGHVTPNQAGRHSAATNMLRRGASTREVQYILGHASVRSTERYTHPIALDQGRFAR
jgi:integrase